MVSFNTSSLFANTPYGSHPAAKSVTRALPQAPSPNGYDKNTLQQYDGFIKKQENDNQMKKQLMGSGAVFA